MSTNKLRLRAGWKSVENLFIHVHEKQCGKLAHALAVADLCVIDRVSSKHVEQRLLPTQ